MPSNLIGVGFGSREETRQNKYQILASSNA